MAQGLLIFFFLRIYFSTYSTQLTSYSTNAFLDLIIFPSVIESPLHITYILFVTEQAKLLDYYFLMQFLPFIIAYPEGPLLFRFFPIRDSL